MQKETQSPTLSIRTELLRRAMQRTPESGESFKTLQMITLIQSVGKAFSMRLNADLAGSGLTQAKFYVLGYLLSEEILGHDAPGPSAIADNLGVTRGTVTGLLDGLERDGYLERCPDRHDRRALTIQLTDKARGFLDSFLPANALELTQEIALDEPSRDTMIRLLRQLEARLRK